MTSLCRSIDRLIDCCWKVETLCFSPALSRLVKHVFPKPERTLHRSVSAIYQSPTFSSCLDLLVRDVVRLSLPHTHTELRLEFVCTQVDLFALDIGLVKLPLVDWFKQGVRP